MKRETLLKIINRAQTTEDGMVHIIAEHIKGAMEWCTAPAGEKKKIVETLQRLSDESREHSKVLDEIRDYIIKENKDVY